MNFSFDVKNILLDGGIIYGLKTLKNGTPLVNTDLAVDAAMISVPHNVVTKSLLRDQTSKYVGNIDPMLINLLADTISIGGLKLAIDKFIKGFPLDIKNTFVDTMLIVGSRYVVDKF